MEDKSGGKEGEREEGRDGEGVLIFVYLTERESSPMSCFTA